MRKIVLLCVAGMSTSAMVHKMQMAAKEEGYDCTIAAYGTSTAAEHQDADVILLGPQVRFQIAKIKNQVSVPVEVIDSKAYGRLDGKKVLARVKEILGD